jgi:hypothetical protein
MLQKVCECREGKIEKQKQNCDEVFMDKVKRERKEREGRKKERKKVKCHEMFGDRKDERFNVLVQLNFYVLKIKK